MNTLIARISNILILISILMLGSCSRGADGMRDVELQNKIEDLKPGLGEIMSVIQQHHAKLYFSGDAQNWDLSRYQLDEIKELLEDAVKYHPVFKDGNIPIHELVPTIMTKPLNEMLNVIDKKDKTDFMKAYDNLTISCNRCHQSAQHGYIVIQTPKGNEFLNQRFTP